MHHDHLTRLLVVLACARLEEDDAAVQAFVGASACVAPVGIGLEDIAVSRPLWLAATCYVGMRMRIIFADPIAALGMLLQMVQKAAR